MLCRCTWQRSGAENDSHGELIYSIAEYGRYTGDSTFAELMWPHVQGAYNYMEQLRASERTDENRARNPAFYGMMPARSATKAIRPSRCIRTGTISGPCAATRMRHRWRPSWARSKPCRLPNRVTSSVMTCRPRCCRRCSSNIDYLPGSAELGDFDATSTTIALAPGGEQGAFRSRRSMPLSSATGRNSWPVGTASASGRTTRPTSGATWPPSSALAGAIAPGRRLSSSSRTVRRRPGTSGPKSSRARRASRSSSVTCRMPGSPRTSCARP